MSGGTDWASLTNSLASARSLAGSSVWRAGPAGRSKVSGCLEISSFPGVSVGCPCCGAAKELKNEMPSKNGKYLRAFIWDLLVSRSLTRNLPADLTTELLRQPLDSLQLLDRISRKQTAIDVLDV